MTDYFEIMKDISRMHAAELLDARDLLNPSDLPSTQEDAGGVTRLTIHSTSLASAHTSLCVESLCYCGGREL